MENDLLKPRIRQGYLRALLFLIGYFVMMVVMMIPVMFLVNYLTKGTWKISNLNENLAELKGDYLWLMAVSGFGASFLSVYFFRRILDRKTFYSLGFKLSGYGPDAATGFLLSSVILGLGALILYFSHHLQWVGIDFDGRQLFIDLGILILVAFSEEIVFRGYILGNLMDSFNRWIALCLSSLVFGLMHMNNDAFNFIALLNIFLAGILLGLNYIYTRNLWYAFFLHVGWNFLQGPLLGFRVSGINMHSLLQMEMHGDDLLTGGNFGFEGSLFNAALVIFAVLFVYMMYEKKEKTTSPQI